MSTWRGPLKATRPILVFVAASLLHSCMSADSEDKNPFCADWASSGECARNPTYMQQQCGRSCPSPADEAAADLAVEPRTSQDTVDPTAQEPIITSSPEDAMARMYAQAPKESRPEPTGKAPDVWEAAKTEMLEKIFASENFPSVESDSRNGGVQDDDSTSQDGAPLSKEEQLEISLRRCQHEAENRVTEARQYLFGELDQSHKKDVTDQLWMQERENKNELEGVRRSCRRKEAELTAHAAEARRRMEEAEHRLHHITSGEQHRQALERADRLASSLGDEEATRVLLETQVREQLASAAARELHLQEALAAATARAALGESTAARLRRQLWLRRRQLVKKTKIDPPEAEAVGAVNDSSIEAAESFTQCLPGAVPIGPGICKRKKVGDEVVIQPEVDLPLPGESLYKSILEAMQILSPMQDLMIWRMHADLCLAQIRTTDDPCTESSAFNVTSWLAAFAWVALWRCVWVLSIRYFSTCCGSLIGRSVRLWDRFSDWFCGFRGKQELATQEL